MNILNDLLADGPIAALHFHTSGGSSRGVRAFIGELAAVLSGTPKKPLIIASDHELTAVFRFFQFAELRDARRRNMTLSGSKRFTDIDGYTGSAYMEIEYGDGHDCKIALPEGAWAGNRTPDNTARSALPVFDSGAISKGIGALLERWTDAGKLVDVEPDPSSFRKWESEVTYGELDISADPRDWDPADPRRRDPELIKRVRELRRERGLSR